MDGNGQKQIVVNGKDVATRAENLADLLAELALADSPLVAERNGTGVPQANFVGTLLADGDAIELVRFVGGG